MTNLGKKLLLLFLRYQKSGESLFEATEATFFESCLLLDADSDLEKRMRILAKRFVLGKAIGQSGRPFAKGPALLCLGWFGTSVRELVTLFPDEDTTRLPVPVARAWLAVVASMDPKHLPDIQKKLVGHPSDDVARLSRFLDDLLAGRLEKVDRYKNTRTRWPLQGKFFDARGWIKMELVAHSKSKTLRQRARSDLQDFAKLARTRQEKRVLARIHRALRSRAAVR